MSSKRPVHSLCVSCFGKQKRPPLCERQYPPSSRISCTPAALCRPIRTTARSGSIARTPMAVWMYTPRQTPPGKVSPCRRGSLRWTDRRTWTGCKLKRSYRSSSPGIPRKTLSLQSKKEIKWDTLTIPSHWTAIFYRKTRKNQKKKNSWKFLKKSTRNKRNSLKSFQTEKNSWKFF